MDDNNSLDATIERMGKYLHDGKYPLDQLAMLAKQIQMAYGMHHADVLVLAMAEAKFHDPEACAEALAVLPTYLQVPFNEANRKGKTRAEISSLSNSSDWRTLADWLRNRQRSEDAGFKRDASRTDPDNDL